MRKFVLLFLLLIIPNWCVAYTLHVGELSFPLHTTKYTTPSMNFLINGEVYYLPLAPIEQLNTLHVSYNDTVYTACSGTQQKIGNYYFVGNCLVNADDNVYLESTGTQYIDTGINVVKTDTSAFIVDGIFYDDAGMFFGSNYFVQLVIRRGIYDITNDNVNYELFMSVPTGNRDIVQSSWSAKDTTNYLYVNNNLVAQISRSGASRLSNDICLFAICNGGLPVGSSQLHARIYNVKVIKDYEITMRHFVPVPIGLQIGNYTVPSNGMWDIVEQRFYGNAGTGEFIYGVDE